ncbi:zinc-dependent alcohol dehydrogenase [Leadbettera azotonutricia]|nr:zinc-binding dehydrogenase [Leadbettera azotonutricia]
MKALKFLGGGKSAIEDVPIPQPGPGEALIKIAVSAICGSERRDYLNGCDFISGHEFAGEVAEINNCRNVKPGDRVSINVIKGCGECLYCQTGSPQLCHDSAGCAGGHAEYAVVAERCCLPLPKNMPWDIGVLLGGDTFGVAHRAVSKLPSGTGKIAVVSGAGPIGIGVSLMLKYCGYYVLAVESIDRRRNFILNEIGVNEACDPAKTDIKKRLFDLYGQIGPDVVIECSGNAEAQKNALSWVKAGGTVVFCGENTKGLTIIPSVDIIHKEVTLTGAFYFNKNDFYNLCRLYSLGFDPLKAVGQKVPLDESPQAFESFFGGQAGKILLTRI